MGVCLSFASDDSDEVTDSDQVATTKGWAAFAEWAAGLGQDYPDLAYLAEEGGLSGAQGIAAVEEELARALHGRPNGPSADVLTVGHRLLQALRDRPPHADAVCVAP